MEGLMAQTPEERIKREKLWAEFLTKMLETVHANPEGLSAIIDESPNGGLKLSQFVTFLRENGFDGVTREGNVSETNQQRAVDQMPPVPREMSEGEKGPEELIQNSAAFPSSASPSEGTPCSSTSLITEPANPMETLKLQRVVVKSESGREPSIQWILEGSTDDEICNAESSLADDGGRETADGQPDVKVEDDDEIVFIDVNADQDEDKIASEDNEEIEEPIIIPESALAPRKKKKFTKKKGASREHSNRGSARVWKKKRNVTRIQGNRTSASSEEPQAGSSSLVIPQMKNINKCGRKKTAIPSTKVVIKKGPIVKKKVKKDAATGAYRAVCDCGVVVTSTVGAFRRHQKFSCRNRKAQEKILCNFKGCSVSRLRPDDMKEHVIAKHEQALLYKCPSCELLFETRNSKNRHFARRHGKKTDEMGEQEGNEGAE